MVAFVFALAGSSRKSYRPASVEPWIDSLNAFEEVASTEVRCLGLLWEGGGTGETCSREVPYRDQCWLGLSFIADPYFTYCPP